MGHPVCYILKCTFTVGIQKTQQFKDPLWRGRDFGATFGVKTCQFTWLSVAY